MMRTIPLVLAFFLACPALAADPVRPDVDARALHAAAEQVWADAPELARQAADLPVMTTRAGGSRLGAGTPDPRVAPVHLDLAVSGDLEHDARLAHARAGASLLQDDLSLAQPLLTSDDPGLRGAVLAGLSRNTGRDAGFALAEATADPDANNRAIAVALLGARTDAADHAGALARAASDSSPEVRRLAVRALGYHKVVAQQAVVQARLSDRDAKVRFTALRALERIDRNAAVNAAKGLQSDPDRNVRRAASELVGQ